MLERYYCPVCNSHDIEITQVVKPQRPPRVSLDEIGKQKNKVIEAVLHMAKYEAVCRDCGYLKEFTQ